MFAKGAGSTDNSLIGTDRSLIAENNYGYQISAGDLSGGEHRARADAGRRGQEEAEEGQDAASGSGGRSFRCRTVWTSDERAPSVVPKLSLGNGLVYTYTQPQRDRTASTPGT